jgi:hypothetical protein
LDPPWAFLGRDAVAPSGSNRLAHGSAFSLSGSGLGWRGVRRGHFGGGCADLALRISKQVSSAKGYSAE